MISTALLAVAAATAPAARAVAMEDRLEYAQIIVRSHIVIRVQTAPVPAPPPQTSFREKKGPRCVPLAGLAGSAVIAPNSVDLALRDGRRVGRMAGTSSIAAAGTLGGGAAAAGAVVASMSPCPESSQGSATSGKAAMIFCTPSRRKQTYSRQKRVR